MSNSNKNKFALKNFKKPILSLSEGFTLIELLVVLAIIGILASIILVNLDVSKKREKMSEFKFTASSMNASLVVECDKKHSGYTGMAWW